MCRNRGITAPQHGAARLSAPQNKAGMVIHHIDGRACRAVLSTVSWAIEQECGEVNYKVLIVWDVGKDEALCSLAR